LTDITIDGLYDEELKVDAKFVNNSICHYYRKSL
jgi:hypothetical protein